MWTQHVSVGTTRGTALCERLTTLPERVWFPTAHSRLNSSSKGSDGVWALLTQAGSDVIKLSLYRSP